MEVVKGGHDEIRPVYSEQFADWGMSRDYAERPWHLFLKKGNDYTEYPILKEQERVTGYRNSAVALEGEKGNLISGSNPNIDNLPEDVNDDGNWNFDGAIGESTRRVRMNWKLQDLQEECQKSK